MLSKEEESSELMSIKSHYRSGKDDLSKDFFNPCLSKSIFYKRATGYFSSSVLVSWVGMLFRLLNDKCKVEMIISPQLSKVDKDALLSISSPEEKEEYLQKIGDSIIQEIILFKQEPNNMDTQLSIFMWLVASNKLEIRFAYSSEGEGIYHPKIGVIKLESGERVAFTGSANETGQGHVKNFESIDVFREWIKEDKERVQDKEEEFDEQWEGKAEGLIIKTISRQVLAEIKERAPREKPIINKVSKEDKNYDKWRHQQEAISCFLSKKKGILEMATGTGKTYTAIRICEELVRDKQVDTIIINTEGNDLLNQWYINILKEKDKFEGRFAVLKQYGGYKERDIYLISPKNKILIINRADLSVVLKRIGIENRRSMIVVYDEVHRLGSPSNIESLKGLTKDIPFVLGLSATPEREYDEEGNKFILEHIGPVIFRFGLEEAIRKKILCPFNYIPIEYELLKEEKKKIVDIRIQYEKLKETDKPMTETDMYMSIAYVYKTSEAKIPLFLGYIEKNQELLKRSIVFVETMEYGNRITDIIHKFTDSYHTYFATEGAEVLKEFSCNKIGCLITCHKISEGIDIRDVNNIILFASNRSKLELIQRIGRCLRSDPDNPNKVANVIDFIRSTDTDNTTGDDDRKKWLQELSEIRGEE